MTIIISLLGQRHCRHVIISIKKNRPQTGLWPRAVMVGPRPRVLLTPSLQVGVKNELGLRNVGVFIREKVRLKNSLSQ